MTAVVLAFAFGSFFVMFRFDIIPLLERIVAALEKLAQIQSPAPAEKPKED